MDRSLPKKQCSKCELLGLVGEANPEDSIVLPILADFYQRLLLLLGGALPRGGTTLSLGDKIPDLMVHALPARIVSCNGCIVGDITVA